MLPRLGGALALWIAVAVNAGSATLRLGFPVALETLDPMRADNMWAQANAGTLFDQLYTYDYLARPVKLVPLAAEALPDVSANGREITVRIRPGIRFTPHPAFGGKARELTAHDFVYSVKRLVDPGLRSVSAALFSGKIEGLDEWVHKAGRAATRDHFDTPVAGVIAVDRYVVRLRLVRPDPTFVFLLASPVLSIVPREAVEADGAGFAQRPTGSGPYVMREFQSGSRLVLERNPNYRNVRWGDLAAPHAEEPAWAAALRERRFPLPDRVEVLHIAEPTTGLLAFEKGQIDVWPATAESTAIANGRLASRLARTGTRLVEGADASALYLYFNMRDPTIGGASVERIALRRAIAMAIDDTEYIRIMGNGLMPATQHPIPPGLGGHDPNYRNPNAFDPVAANALLDRAGFRRESGSYRRDPAGKPLRLSVIISTSSEGRRWAEFLKRSLDRIGVQLVFEAIPIGDRLQRMSACQFQMTTMDWGFDWPDGSNLMLAFHGAAVGTVGMSCMQDAEFDRAYDELSTTSFGPARDALFRRMIGRLDVLMPARLLPAAEVPYLTRPQIRGLVIHPAIQARFPFVDAGSP
jgi:ABC-type transport system substrate-binding protein